MSDQELLTAISEIVDEKLDQKLDQKLEEKLAPIYRRLDRLESQTAALQDGQKEMHRDIREMDRKVSDTYQIALDAWGQSTENRVWLQEKATV